MVFASPTGSAWHLGMRLRVPHQAPSIMKGTILSLQLFRNRTQAILPRLQRLIARSNDPGKACAALPGAQHALDDVSNFNLVLMTLQKQNLVIAVQADLQQSGRSGALLSTRTLRWQGRRSPLLSFPLQHSRTQMLCLQDKYVHPCFSIHA